MHVVVRDCHPEPCKASNPSVRNTSGIGDLGADYVGGRDVPIMWERLPSFPSVGFSVTLLLYLRAHPLPTSPTLEPTRSGPSGLAHRHLRRPLRRIPFPRETVFSRWRADLTVTSKTSKGVLVRGLSQGHGQMGHEVKIRDCNGRDTDNDSISDVDAVQGSSEGLGMDISVHYDD